MWMILCCLSFNIVCSTCFEIGTACLSCSFQNFLDQEVQDNVNECVLRIIKEVQLNDSISDAVLINVDDVTSKQLHRLQSLRFITRNSSWHISKVIHIDVYVIMCNHFEDLDAVINSVQKDSYWNPGAKFIITINNLADANIQDVEDNLLKNNIFDINILVKSEDGYENYAFLSQFDSCNKPTALGFIFHCYDRSKAYSKIIKPQDTAYINKPRKLHGCHMKLVSHNFWPYILFNNISLIGVEHYAINILNEVEGISVEIEKFEPDEQFGEILDNFTYTGMLHKIETNEVDGAIGGYYMTPRRNRNMDSTYPYMVDHIVVIVPRAGWLKIWQAVYKQLTFITVILVVLFFGIFWILAVKLSLFNKIHEKDRIRDFLIVFGYFFNNSFKLTKTGVPQRLVVLNMLIFVFWISCTTQASLLSATTRPMRRYQVTDLDEVIGIYEPIVIDQYAYSEDGVQWATRVCKSVTECLIAMKDNEGNFVYTMVPEIIYDYQVWKLTDDKGYLQVYKIRESVGTLLGTVYFRRGSTLVQTIDNHIQRMNSAGLLGHQLARLRFMAALKHHYYHDKVQRATALSNLNDIYIILIIGYCLSVAIFIYEFSHKKCVHLFRFFFKTLW